MRGPAAVPPLLRAARQVVLVLGVGALGAALCSASALLVAPIGSRTPSGLGEPPVAGRMLSPADLKALALLRRAVAAEGLVSYHGAKVFTSWSIWGHAETMASVRNVVGQGRSVWVTPAPGGAPGADQAGVPDSAGSALGDLALSILTDHYRLAIGGTESMFDRPVTRVDVHSLTDRVSGKLWVDDETGLILRRELKDGAGTIIRRSWFSDLTIDDVRAPADGPAASLVSSSGGSAAAGGGGAALDDADLDRLRKGGTVIPAYLPAGMRLVGAWRLPLTGPDAIALSYSDGLFSLSLFLQPGVLDQSDLTGFTAHQVAGAGVWAHCGLSREVTWAGDATVYTIVTDAPDATVTAVIGALPADPPAEGMVSRMGRGAHRVASWVDPFS